MPDGGGGGGEGGGSSEYLPMDDLVEAMLRSSQALAEALAADRARREAADRIQREFWEAALKQKDAEIDRLRAEAAEAKKKLQADAGRKMKWEAAYELLLGANQKLAELRDTDMEDSRTCAETLNSKEVGSCTKLSQNTVDHTASDFRKLKHDYETLSSKKDKEVSALLSENDSLRSQLDIMQQDNAELLKNKKVEEAQALTLKKSVDDLKVLAQKKDHEIVILRAKAVAAKKKVQQMHSLVKEKDDEIQRLKCCHAECIQKHYRDISQTHEKSRSVDPVVYVRTRLKNTHLRQIVEKDYMSETKTVEKNGQEESTQKRRRAFSMSNDVEKRGSYEDGDKQIGSDEDGDKKTGSGEQSGRVEETTHNQVQKPLGNPKRKRDTYTAQVTNGKWRTPPLPAILPSSRDVCDDDETINNPVQKPLGNSKRKGDACNARVTHCKATVKTRVRTQWYWNYTAPAPLCSHKRKKKIRNGQCQFVRVSTGNWAQYVRDVNVILADQPDKHNEFIEFLCNFENWRIEDVARTMAILLDGHPELIYRFNRFLPRENKIVEEEEKLHPDESAAAAAGLIKLKEAEQQPNRERA